MAEIPQELIEQANMTDLVDFLRSQGEEVFQDGHEYRWRRHDSVTLKGNQWFQHSQGRGGFPIDFVKTFYDLPFREAVWTLQNGSKTVSVCETDRRTRTEPELRLPQRNGSNQHIIFYLEVERKISPDILRPFLDSGVIYEESCNIFQNVVFLGLDLDGIPRSAIRRGVLAQFRREVPGSDKRFGFHHVGQDHTLCVFESPIDLLSFTSLYPKAMNSHLLSMGGCTNYKSVNQYLDDHPGIRTVFLCLDSDPAGQGACEHLEQFLPATYTVGRLVPALKDWNDILRSNEPVSAPYTLKYRSVPTN